MIDEDTLIITFGPAAFHEGWSGSVEIRFKTPQARTFVERLASTMEEKWKV